MRGKTTMELTEYDAKRKAEQLKAQVAMGIIPEFMLEEIIWLSSDIPVFAKVEVLKLALKK